MRFPPASLGVASRKERLWDLRLAPGDLRPSLSLSPPLPRPLPLSSFSSQPGAYISLSHFVYNSFSDGQKGQAEEQTGVRHSQMVSAAMALNGMSEPTKIH